MINRINTIEYLTAHPEVKQIVSEDTYNGTEQWLNDGYTDDYIHGIYYPCTFLRQHGSTSTELIKHITDMKLDYKMLNKIYRHMGDYNNLSSKAEYESNIIEIARAAVSHCNCMGDFAKVILDKDGKYAGLDYLYK